jgi:hypothetical protein
MPRRRSKAAEATVTERDVQDAVAVITRDYYSDVADHGDDLIARIKSGDITDPSDFSDILHQDIDGAARVIYTWQARLGLIASENHDAYFEEGIGDLDCRDSVPYEVLMFYAMQQDVIEYMATNGCDPNDEDCYAEEED